MKVNEVRLLIGSKICLELEDHNGNRKPESFGVRKCTIPRTGWEVVCS